MRLRHRRPLDEMVRFRSYQSTVAAGPGVGAHSHEASLDETGDGQTSKEEGHTHRVSDGVVQSAMGHSHELLDYEPRRTIYRSGPGNKPTSEPKKRKSREKAAGVGPQGTGTAMIYPGMGAMSTSAQMGGAIQAASGAMPPMESLQRYNEDYGFVGAPYQRVGWDSKREAFDKYEILRNVVAEFDSILDVGCGTGLLYEWLTRRFKQKVNYCGIDRSLPFLREFVGRYPEVTNRLTHVDALMLGEEAAESLPLEHFDVATAFGLTADMGSGDEQYGRLHSLGSFMRRVSDIQVIEFWDRLRFKDRDAGILEGVPPSTWSPAKVKKVFANLPHEIIRPLSPGGEDFAVVTWHPDVIG